MYFSFYPLIPVIQFTIQAFYEAVQLVSTILLGRLKVFFIKNKKLSPKQSHLLVGNNHCHSQDFCCNFSQNVVIDIPLQSNQGLKFIIHFSFVMFPLLSLEVI